MYLINYFISYLAVVGYFNAKRFNKKFFIVK